MADWGLSLIAKILEEKNVRLPIQKGIDEDTFSGSSNLLAKEMYKYILRHYDQYNSVPSLDIISEKFQEYTHFNPGDDLKVICDKFLDYNLQSRINSSLIKVRHSNINEGKRGLQKLQEELTLITDIYKTPDDDYDIKENRSLIIDEYETLFKEGDGMVGIPFPWATLNRITRGLQPEHLVVFYGSAKSCKTWVLLVVSSSMFFEQGKNVLFITREMGKQEIARRCAVIFSKVSFRKYLTGSLDEEEENRLYDTFKKMDNQENYFKISTGLNDLGKANVNTIGQKIKKYKPDVVCVDASYMLDDIRTKTKSTEHNVITNITQDLKALALKEKVPFVITTQANRYGDSSTKDGAMAFSASYLRDADLIVRILRKPEEQQIMMKVDGAREGEEDIFVINSKIANDFSEDMSADKKLDSFIKADKKGIASAYETKKEDSPAPQKIEFKNRYTME